MIISSLYARNFQKYEEIFIADFPAKGFVGIIGENESGKSTILEMVSFALYGRTLKADETEFMRLIHWRANKMELRLGFQHDGKNYAILRKCDREGDNTAQAFHILASGTETIICEGVQELHAFLYKLFPVSFAAFRHSFYLGQKELGALYERRNSGSIEVIEELTGITRLKKAQDKNKIAVSPLRTRLEILERELAVLDTRREMFAEQLQEKEQLECDLERQRNKLLELNQQLTEKGAKNDVFEHFRRRLIGFRALFERLENDYLGYEFMQLLKSAGQGFLQLWFSMQDEMHRNQQEIDSRTQEIKAREQELIQFSGLHAEIKIIQALGRERTQQIEREMRSQLSSQNLHNSFIPSTLQERNMLCEKQMSNWRQHIRNDEKSFNFCLAFFLALVGFIGFFFLHYGHVFAHADIYFRSGASLFLGAASLLLLSLLYGFHKSASRGREDYSRLQMNFGTFQRETGRLRDELEALRTFANSYSLRSLQNLSNRTEYPSLRKALTDLIEKYPQGCDGDCTLDKIKRFDLDLQELKNNRQALQERYDSLRQLEIDFRHWHQEITSWDFIDSAEISRLEQNIAEYAGRYFEHAALILKLKQVLHNDYSFSMERLSATKSIFENSLAELLGIADVLSGLPEAWNPELLYFNYLSKEDLSAEQLQAHDRKLVDQRNQITNFINACFEKYYFGKEHLIRYEADKLGVEQKIGFLEETLSKLRQTAQKSSEIERHTQIRRQEKQEKTAELERRLVLAELFKGTIESMQTRLSPALSKFIGHILPRITDERYSKVRVSKELEIEVFSPEKDGYVDLMSLSGGTVDQLLICLRLAFASSLLQSSFAPDYQQFLLLDEPLYAFDARRSDNFLEIVRDFFTSGLAQVFVVTHNHNLIGQMDFVLEPQRSDSKLAVNFSDDKN